MTTVQTSPARGPLDVLRSANMAEDGVRRAVARHGDGLSYALAMNLAAAYQRLVAGGIPCEAAIRIVVAQPAGGVSRPHDQADAVVAFVERAVGQGMDRPAAIAAAVELWARDPHGPREVVNPILASRGGRETDATGRGDHPGHTPIREIAGVRRNMTDQEKRNGTELERLKLEKERERLEHEREKLELEREKLERLQEQMEERIERQQERLEELEDELEAREEELEEREEELEGLEVEGAEGIREVLDVVSERIPNLMRGIQETVYSPEHLKKTSDAIATFYKNLVDAGMDEDQAAEMTKMQMVFMQTQSGLGTTPPRGARIRHSRPPRPARPARSTRSEEPAEPPEPHEEDEA